MIQNVLYKEVADRIECYIEDEEFQENDKLPSERKLAEMLGVSRNVVREALRALEEKGIIDIQKCRGAFLKNTKEVQILGRLKQSFTQESVNLMNIMEVREAIELVIIEQCVSNITDEQITLLFAVHEEMKKKVNGIEFSKLDEEFHKTIAAATGNPMFHILLKAFYDEIGRNIFLVTRLNENANEAAIQEHEALLTAIKKRDVIQAKIAMKQHLESTKKDLMQLSK